MRSTSTRDASATPNPQTTKEIIGRLERLASPPPSKIDKQMKKREKDRHMQQDTQRDRSQMTVLAGLPVEVWALIVEQCDADDMPALAKACPVLRQYAWQRVDRICLATHASVDAFVTRWEKKTWWGDRRLASLSCRCRHGMGWQDDSDTDDDSDDEASDGDSDCRRNRDDGNNDRKVPTIRWRAYGTSRWHGGPYEAWLCDVCGHRALAEIHYANGADEERDDRTTDRHRFHTICEIDLDRRHVWASHRQDFNGGDFVYADRVDGDDFVVPATVAHLLDPCLFARLAYDSAAQTPSAYGYDGVLARIGSIRGWMPLRRRRTHASSYQTEDVDRAVLMICCDVTNPMWGALAVVRFHGPRLILGWHCGDRSLGALIARWREHPLRLQDARFAMDWVEWAIDMYVADMHRIRQREAQMTIDDHGGTLERMLAEDHASSGKPWVQLLDAEEHSLFFDDHDAVDDVLDRDSGLYETTRQRQRQRQRRRHHKGRRGVRAHR
ncbi:hypothetical protein pqer_cds_1075 [Pandoravirus quercus]|uniref:F-box domain containing protein n=2 Tax=Pandoravirus TaxID=2060084 RepID=A0A2U7UAM5_9VIRU|nr:hypothetical protein pqer_cds_1075 [Pandoravirus quercus]AVK75497.1 hypothetical protein pqer_cds_1075 [Pandoravirus quercus]QBZ81677.1 hypothetical protein pclt_cds_1094 [Pandoravirus celtis]